MSALRALLELTFDATTDAKRAPCRPSHRAESLPIEDLGIDCSSVWGEGVAVIESVLDPSSVAGKALTPEQREGLMGVRSLLLTNGTKEECHIPKSLLEKNSEDACSCYILEEFGGVRKTARHFKLRNVVVAHSFVRSLQKNSMRSVAEHFLPEEWSALSLKSRQELREKLSWESLSRWDFNVFELAKLCGGTPLLFLGWAILGSPYSQQAMADSFGEEIDSLKWDGYNFLEPFRVPPNRLCAFLRAIEGEYLSENPYHNNTHAADVVQTMHTLVQMGGKDFARGDIELFAILLAAAIHDVGHPGYNNGFQINARTDLALEYNDVSVLENMHASKAFRHLLGTKREPEMDILSGMKPEQLARVRKVMVDAVLHTDMSKHFRAVDDMKGLLASHSLTEIKKENSVEVLLYVMHLADISNPAKPAPIFVDWADCCLAEFFAQGDREADLGLPISPLCDRAKTSRPQSQIGFIRYVVKPSFEVLGKLLPDVQHDVLPLIEKNLEFWEKEQSEDTS